MKRISVRKLNERVRMLTQANEFLRNEVVALKIKIDMMRSLPTFDKEMMLRLLEVVYAAKGGMASWGRR